MFRPVQNPDDEEAEGRVRTRTRTKELVNQFLSLALLNYLLVLCVCARAPIVFSVSDYVIVYTYVRWTYVLYTCF